jgi:hypothetical protein
MIISLYSSLLIPFSETIEFTSESNNLKFLQSSGLEIPFENQFKRLASSSKNDTLNHKATCNTRSSINIKP